MIFPVNCQCTCSGKYKACVQGAGDMVPEFFKGMVHRTDYGGSDYLIDTLVRGGGDHG